MSEVALRDLPILRVLYDDIFHSTVLHTWRNVLQQETPVKYLPHFFLNGLYNNKWGSRRAPTLGGTASTSGSIEARGVLATPSATAETV